MDALADIARETQGIAVILGTITPADNNQFPLTPFYNTAAVLQDGQVAMLCHKQLLPNYDIFDEHRYFAPGDTFDPFYLNDVAIGIEICEDLWDDSYPMKVTKELKANATQILVNINASPYNIGKPELRDQVIAAHVRNYQIPLIYVNLVGGQDEVVFDGRSLIVDEQGRAVFRAPAFEEGLYTVDFDWQCLTELPEVPLEINLQEDLFKALVV